MILISDIRKDVDGVARMRRSKKMLSIGVYSKNRRTYRFRFKTEAEAKEWEGAIRSHM